MASDFADDEPIATNMTATPSPTTFRSAPRYATRSVFGMSLRSATIISGKNVENRLRGTTLITSVARRQCQNKKKIPRALVRWRIMTLPPPLTGHQLSSVRLISDRMVVGEGSCSNAQLPAHTCSTVPMNLYIVYIG